MTQPEANHIPRHSCVSLPHKAKDFLSTIVSGMRHNFCDQTHLSIVHCMFFPIQIGNSR
jgi:hypothetical protein